MDEIYQADQEVEDYNALSTEDDSDAAKSDTGALANKDGEVAADE